MGRPEPMPQRESPMSCIQFPEPPTAVFETLIVAVPAAPAAVNVSTTAGLATASASVAAKARVSASITTM